jgi:WD40 repeat protein
MLSLLVATLTALGEPPQDSYQGKKAALRRAVDVSIASAAPVVVVAVGDNSLRVLDANDGAVRATWAPPPEATFEPWAVALDPTGDTVAVFTRDAAVHLWRWREPGPPLCLTGLAPSGAPGERAAPIRDFGVFLEWSAKGDRLLAGVGESWALLFDATGKCLAVIEGLRGESRFAPLCWDLAGARFAAGLAEGPVLYDAATGKRLETQPERRPELPPGEVQSLAFAPNGKRLAVGLDERRIRCFDVESGHCAWTTEIPEFWFGQESTKVAAVAFSPNGKLIAGSSKRSVHALLFEADSGKHVLTGEWRHARFGEPAFVEWAPDGESFFLAYVSGVMPIAHVRLGPPVSEMELLRGSLPEFGWNGIAVHRVEGAVRALVGGSGEVKWSVPF